MRASQTRWEWLATGTIPPARRSIWLKWVAGLGCARLTGLAAFVLASVILNAARISEPPTVAYGKVVFRSVGRELTLTEGELNWTLRGSAPTPWERGFSTRLTSLRGGRYSYRLLVPHDLLSHNLETSGAAVPLLAIPTEIEHAQVTFNGLPAVIMVPAANFFRVSQNQRAATLRVDLDVSRSLTDIDGDGLPDVWEDQNGYDKWNPADGAEYFRGSGGTTEPDPDPEALTFAQWRSLHFPDDASDLDSFGAADHDADGIPNLVEYAFGLNPTDSSDPAGLDRLPQARIHEGEFRVEFEPSAPPSEVEYRFEVSSDLTEWQAAGAVSAQAAASGSGHRFEAMSLSVPEASASETMRFVRCQVIRQP